MSRIGGLFGGLSAPWRQDWLATDVYFKTCITKPRQVGHRLFLMLSSDYNFLRSTVSKLNNFIQYSHCQVVQLF